MTTQQTPLTPAQAAEAFREEIRANFENLEIIITEQRVEIAELRAYLEAIRAGLMQAATATAPQVGTFNTMQIDSIIMTYSDKGEPTYKATGAPYQKFGVRIWPETLPALGIDPLTLKPGPNPQAQPIPARVLMNQPEEGKTAQPRKVTGRA